MTKDQARAAFLSMPTKAKARFLSRLALNVTVCARSGYLPEVSNEQARSTLSGFNEVLHTITGQLVRIISEDERRYPDPVFLDILFEKADTGGCEKDLLQAFQWGMARAD